MGFALLFFTLIAMHIYYVNAFFTQLKHSHAALWKKLGEPRWKIHFGDDSFKNAMRYIHEKKFTDLHDDVLDRVYKNIKHIENISIATAVIIVLATILSVIKGS